MQRSGCDGVWWHGVLMTFFFFHCPDDHTAGVVTAIASHRCLDNGWQVPGSPVRPRLSRSRGQGDQYSQCWSRVREPSCDISRLLAADHSSFSVYEDTHAFLLVEECWYSENLCSVLLHCWPPYTCLVHAICSMKCISEIAKLCTCVSIIHSSLSKTICAETTYYPCLAGLL